LFYYHSFDIPGGWKVCKLIDISEFIHRGKSPVYSSIERIPVIAQKCNQKDGSLSLEKAMFIDPESLCKYDNNKISKPNDIIVNSTGTGTVGRVNILRKSLFEKYQTIVTDSHVTTIRLIDNECDPYYIYFYLRSPLIYDRAEERSEGSTNQIELYAKTIMNYFLCLPPKKEQTRIVQKISRLLSHL
jgi:type I restriction enzyme S subunit